MLAKIRLLPFLFALLGAGTPSAHAAEATGCPGKDVLGQWATTNAAAVARIRAAADAAPNGKGWLWKLESVDNPDRPPSYLFAVIPFSDDRLKQRSAAVSDALDHTNRIVTGTEDAGPARLGEAFGVMPETLAVAAAERYDAGLPKSDAQRVSAVLAKSELAKDWQPRVRPWVALALTQTSDCERSRIAQGKATESGDFEHDAENRGVGYVGIETTEATLSGLAGLTVPEQASLLKAQLGAHDRLDDRTETLVGLYLKRDIGALWPFEAEWAKAHGADADALDALHEHAIEASNLRIRDRALMHLATGGVFLAVAAEQVPGKTGLVELLKDSGYTLTLIE